MISIMNITRDDMIKLITRYQPNVFLHSEETYNPTTFENLFSIMKLQNDKMIVDMLPSNDWIKGDATNAPFYIFTTINENDKTLTLYYYLLFSFNQGKRISILNRTIGNHYSDLERCELTFDISNNKIKPLRYGYGYHSYYFQNSWDGSILSFYVALGSHGFHVKKCKKYYDNRLRILNVFDDTRKCNKLFNNGKYIVYTDDNYNGISNIAYNEKCEDISLSINGMNNWLNQLKGFGGVKSGKFNVPFSKITVYENTGTIRNPSVNLKKKL